MAIALSFDDPRIASLRTSVREHIQHHILPHAEQWEDLGTTPHEAFAKLGEQGLLGVCHAAEYGGLDLGPVGSVAFAEELAACTYGGFVEAVLIHADMSSTHIAHRGNAAQRQRYLPQMIRGHWICGIAVTEPEAGSDVAGMQTTARREGDSYVLNGVKTYATNALHGDVMIVAARTDLQAKASRGISLFIVERNTPGLQIESMVAKHGLLSSDMARMSFNNARVPADCLLGEENRGFYGIMENFQNERLVLGAMALGMSKQALALTLDFVKSRKAFGGTIWDLQTTRQRLALLAARLSALRSLVHETAQRIANGEDGVREVSMVKALAGETAQDIMRDCLQLHGGAGYMRDCAIERMTRDARILSIGGGVTEVMLEEVAKRL